MLLKSMEIRSQTFSIKLAALLWHCFHNSIHILLLRYSRSRNVEDMYFTSVAVFFTEILKVFLCFLMISINEGGIIGFFHKIKKQIIEQPWDTLKICVPSMLYTIQNNLLFIAASHLEAAPFAVISQLKIFSAAIFSVLILERKLSRSQWFSFVVLFSGVALVQLQSGTSISSKSSQNNQTQNPIFGFFIASLACGISGFAGILSEKIFKGTAPVSIWMRNIQMAVFAIPASFTATFIQDGHKIYEHGFLFGFDSIVWCTVFWYGIGGLSAAVCIKYADSISKDFATSLAIILATIGSIYIFGFLPNYFFIFGAALVIFSIFLYSSSITFFYKPLSTNIA